MSTAVETAHPSLPSGKGNYIGEVLPIYGCASPCEVYEIDACFLKCKCGAGMRAKLGRFCEDCKTMRPHDHYSGFEKIARMRTPHFFSGHMAEIADFNHNTVMWLMGFMKCYSSHIYSPFTHRPLEFYTKYPKWPKNVWCCGTWTSGDIAFPAELECGVRMAYCEPVLGEYHFSKYPLDDYKALGFTHPQGLIIGLLNHQKYPETMTLGHLEHIIKSLIADADALGIPVFMKSHKLWAKMGIEVRKEWPKWT